MLCRLGRLKLQVDPWLVIALGGRDERPRLLPRRFPRQKCGSGAGGKRERSLDDLPASADLRRMRLFA